MKEKMIVEVESDIIEKFKMALVLGKKQDEVF